MTQASSDLPIRGDLTVKVRSVKSGRLLRTFVIRNTVTYLGMGTVVQLLSQRVAPPDDPPASLKLAELWVGDGAVPPVRGDTALSMGGPGFRDKITLTDATKTPNIVGPIYELRLLATLPSVTPANGFTLTEAPPVTQKLFARQIHPAIVISVAIAIDYDWRISFTA
jgi:hypothetical protein